MSSRRRVALLLVAAFFVLLMLYLLRAGAFFSPSTTSSDSSRPEEIPKSAASGKTFANKVVRQFPPAQLKFKNFALPVSKKSERPRRTCERWAVVTTIFDPSEAIERQSKLVGWCMVIVGDKKSPADYETGWISGEGNAEVVYLNPQAQEALRNPFVNALPWNHFSRKNVGYLYAVTHGANVIWDFDDDNLFKFWVPGSAPANSPSIDATLAAFEAASIATLHPDHHTFPTYNPYPSLGAPSMPSWPRGLPLNHVKKPESHNATLVPRTMDSTSIAVLQSLADLQPDVDAIYRLIMPIPFNFKRSTETKPVVIPVGVMTPYNAQATLHFRPGFWALLLPITVHGRVSDIWRSYFAQRLFWDVGLHLGFAARPLVMQDRNSHNILGDLNAEEDLYQKSEFLVKFLTSWKSGAPTLVERIEQLWVALYERQYIELRDVQIVQLWLQSLIDSGYPFPSPVSNLFDPPKTREEDSKHVEDKKPCMVSRSLTFWTSDIHDGSRMDTTSVLSGMGQKVIVASAKGGSAPYPKALELSGVSVNTQLSDPLVHSLATPNAKLTESLVVSNFKFYQDNSKVVSTDAFVCGFPAATCELWMPFNRSLVFAPAHRYNLGRCTKAEWERLNEHIRVLASGTDPKHAIAAQSKYDLEYLKHYTGVSPVPLFSYAGMYMRDNGFSYSPEGKEVLVFNFWHDSLSKASARFVLKSASKSDSHLVLDNAANHPAVVFFPNSVSSYLFVELYSLSVPLFVPSMKMLLTERPVVMERTLAGDTYCRNGALDSVMGAHPASNHPYSPNVEGDTDQEAEAYWLQFSDVFQFPHVAYFKNFDDLGKKLEQANFVKIHKLMVKENVKRKEELTQNWCKVAETVEKNRKVPKDYTVALKALYGVTQLQAE